MIRLFHILGALLLLLAAAPAGAEKSITIFNLSAAEVERVEAKTCKAFTDKDAFPYVASDKVRALGTAPQPNWDREESCQRVYCLTAPDWQVNRPEGRSCFTLSIKSVSHYRCTRGFDASCYEYTYTLTLTPAPSSGAAPTPISGETNALKTARYRISLLKTGAIIIADIGPSYRKMPE